MAPKRRVHVRDGDDLLVAAVQEVAASLGPIVAELAESRARFLVADEIQQNDLVPRQAFGDQPSANELLVAILRRLEKHARNPGATATGAHDVARRVGVSMGIVGAEAYPAFRRTRAQVDVAPNPLRRREGRARAAADVRVQSGTERW